MDARRARLPRWATASGRPAPGAGARRRHDRCCPGRPDRFGARSVLGWPRPGPGRVLLAARLRGAHRAAREHGRLRCAAFRIGGSRDRHGAAEPGSSLYRFVHRPRATAQSHRGRRLAQHGASRSRTSSDLVARAAPGLVSNVAPPVRVQRRRSARTPERCPGQRCKHAESTYNAAVRSPARISSDTAAS